MTERTRWDALVEELELADPPKTESRATNETTYMGYVLVGVTAYTNVIVMRDGVAIPAADFQMSWQRNIDMELVRIGALSDEELGRRADETITGSFVTTGNAGIQLGGRSLTLLVRRSVKLGKVEVLQFAINVRTTEWRSNGPCKVTFVGTRTG